MFLSDLCSSGLRPAVSLSAKLWAVWAGKKTFPLKLCNSLKLNILEIGLILCSVLPPESVDLPLLGNVYKQNLNLAVPLRAVPLRAVPNWN